MGADVSNKPVVHGREHWPGGPDPINERWWFVDPIAPATEDDLVDDDLPYPPFENDWGNITDRPATAFRRVDGQLQIRIAATGGEASPGSTIFTLPDTHRPAFTHRITGILGDDSIAVVDVQSDGQVVYIGSITPTP